MQDGDKPQEGSRRGPLKAQILQGSLSFGTAEELEGREFVSVGQSGGTAIAH